MYRSNQNIGGDIWLQVKRGLGEKWLKLEPQAIMNVIEASTSKSLRKNAEKKITGVHG